MSESFIDDLPKPIKGASVPQDANEKVDLEGMELGYEGDLDEELASNEILADEEEGGDTEGDEWLKIQKDLSELVAARYRVDGEPDYFNFATEPLERLADNHTVTTINDYYLRGSLEIPPLISASIRQVAKRHEGWKLVSAYDKAAHKYNPYVELHQPHHGHTEGGKGLALYPAVVIYHTADMSAILNINITFGCPSNCSFCKESLLARGFTQMDFYEEAGIIRVTTESREPFDIPANARVRFFDADQGRVIIGPISVPIAMAWPIATDSLDKLRDGTLFRVLAD